MQSTGDLKLMYNITNLFVDFKNQNALCVTGSRANKFLYRQDMS